MPAALTGVLGDAAKEVVALPAVKVSDQDIDIPEVTSEPVGLPGWVDVSDWDVDVPKVTSEPAGLPPVVSMHNPDDDVPEVTPDAAVHSVETTKPLPWKSVGLVSSGENENRLVIPLKVQADISCQALIDTGASSSMIHVGFLQEHDIPYRTMKGQSMFGFGISNAVPVIGKVILGLQINDFTLKDLELLVIDSPKSSSVPLILTVDFLSVNKLAVNVGKRMMSQYKENGAVVEVYFGAGSSHQTVYRNVPCYALECVSVTQGELTHVPVVCGLEMKDEDGEPTTEPHLLLIEEPNSSGRAQILPGIVCREQQLNILMTTMSDMPVIIKKGEMVCTASTIVPPPEEQSSDASCEIAVAELHTPTESDTSSDAGGDEVKDFNLGDNLTDVQKEAVCRMLEDNKSVFSSNDNEVGILGQTEHKIELYDTTPIFQKPRRVPEPVREEIESQCQELYMQDIIEPSSSAWSSPVVPVRKKDGTLRLCIDYRRLNAVTKPDRFPLPNLSDAVFGLHGVQYFTCLDLIRGYYQLPLDESSREYTAFSTARSHWQFKRLSFGLRNAPAAFQREMQQVLNGFPWCRVIVYIDDVLIMSESFSEHLLLVDKVLHTLATHGVKVKASKCSWFSKEVHYLGHIVSADGLRKPPQYVEKVQAMPPPTTVRGLREFLGLANFQRKFVANFSEIQKPLSEKTGGKGTKRLQWTEEMSTAFETLKARLAEDVQLAFPNYASDAEPLELYVDASGLGAGACLAQSQNSEVRIIAYASKTFSAAETRYSTIERELAALRWGVKTFRPFLIGTEFIVHTDHQPLQYLQNMNIIDSRLARTLEDLSDFNFSIRYTPGKDNTAADALSRLYVPGNVHPGGTGSVDSEWLPRGLVMTERVPGGGDSLFASLHFLSQNVQLDRPSTKSVIELRELLIDDLLNKPEIYGLSWNREEKRRLRACRSPGILPCAEVLLSFSRLFNCAVFVHFGGKTPVIFSAPMVCDDKTYRRVHLQCLSGVHYNPVVEVGAVDFPGASAGRRKVEIPDKIELLDCEESDDAEELEVLKVSSSGGGVTDSWCPKHRHTHVSSTTIKLNGNVYCVLLDSGAQISCISDSVCAELACSVSESATYMIIGLGAGPSPVKGSVNLAINLSDDSHSREQTVAVVDGAMMPFCMILGADYLTLNNVSLDFNGMHCRLTDKVLCNFSGAKEESGVSLGYEVVMGLPSLVREICIGTPVNHLRFGLEKNERMDIANVTSLISMEEILQHQRRSNVLRSLKRKVTDGDSLGPEPLRRFSRYKNELKVENDVLVHSSAAGVTAFVVTFKFLIEFMLVVHYQMAHVGRQKLIDLVSQHVWHPSIAKVASDITSTCDRCQRMKVAPTISPPVRKIETTGPFELFAMDVVALPLSGGNVGCLVAMDHNSKWLCAVPIRSKTSETIASAVEQKILPFLHRKPRKVLTDNGPEFIGGPFQDVMERYGIEHVFTTPNHPASNGLVERANRTLIELLRVQMDSPGEWHTALPRAVIVHNSTYHSALKMSPSKYLLGLEHPSRDPTTVPLSESSRWHEGNPSFATYRVGQLVLRKVVKKGHCTTGKFLERFEGPHRILKSNRNGVTYVLESGDGGADIRVHHDQLKAYRSPPRYLVNHPYFPAVLAQTDQMTDEETDIPGSFEPTAGDVPPYGGYFGGYWSTDSCDTSLDFVLDFKPKLQSRPMEGSTSSDCDERSRDTDTISLISTVAEDAVGNVDPRSYLRLTCDDTDEVQVRVDPVLSPVVEEQTGVIIDTDLWDLSDVLQRESVEFPLGGVVDSHIDTLEGTLCVLQGSLRLLRNAVATDSASFAGFTPRTVGAIDYQGHLDNLQDHIDKLGREVSRLNALLVNSTEENEVLNDSTESIEVGLGTQPSSSEDQEVDENVRGLRSPPVVNRGMITRSRGAAEDLPYIQPRVLEYELAGEG